MGVDIDGLEDVFSELDELQDDFSGGGQFIVGTAVEYSIFLEFGTSKMDPKPFFRPVLREVKSGGVPDFVEDNTNTTVESVNSAEELVQTVAFAIERRIKEVITQKTLVDTGTLRASVLAVPGGSESALPTVDDFDAFSSENPAPASAGRAIANTEIDINE